MIRTIITQDAEVDDQNSLRHFLFYTNEVELQGIVQTSSKFHWEGKKGAKKVEGKDYGTKGTSFEEPFRWTGTDWMFEEINQYEKDYVNLIKHSSNYPTADYLRSITKIGNIGYESDMDEATEGSDLIKERILDGDERKLYIQVWGGTNTIARALYDIEMEFKDKENWNQLHDLISSKVVLLACGEQDTTYRDYIAEAWPDIQFVVCLQMKSYAYLWYLMPECESKDTLKGKFMKEEIMNGKSALADGYCTWFDGTYYPGEADSSQFGSNPETREKWFGARMLGITDMEQYDFLSEGDSPTYFCLFDWGLRSLDDLSYGGFSGRYNKVTDQVNSKGQVLNIWKVQEDAFIGYDGQEIKTESMWRYVADIQRDFASRVDWASKPEYMDAEHKPILIIEEGVDLQAKANELVQLHAHAKTSDNTQAKITYRVYNEVSVPNVLIEAWDHNAQVHIPSDAVPGDQIHVIVEVRANGRYKLVQYKQVIITII